MIAVCATLMMLIFSAGTCLAQQLKIGFVDFGTFAAKSKRFQAQQKRFQALVAQKKATIDRKKKELDDLQEQIQKQAGLLKEDTRNQKIKEASIKQVELKLAEQEAEKTLRNEQRETQEVFLKDVVKIVSAIRKQKGLTMVLNYSALLSADDAFNITGDVVKAYDAQIKAPAPGPRPAPAKKPARR